MKRNKWAFGLGTIGRDMLYSLVSMYMIFYMTDVIHVPTNIFVIISGFLVAARIFDAVNDPFMGLIVDNTRTRFGKFKPWIAFGAFTTGVVTIAIFSIYNLSWVWFAVVFCVLYLLWDVAFTTNDIAYWSMLPALSVNQKEREKIGAVARICANIGLFAVVAGIVPVTKALGDQFGGLPQGYFVFTVIIVVILWLGQLFTLFGVKELHIAAAQKSTPLRELFLIIFKNDQLLITAVSMTLFMIGYMTTTSFGIFYFKYAYGDEDMYSIFAVILGVSQIAALAVFPLLSKIFNRRTLYTLAIALVTVGYVVFFFAPTTTMLFIGAAGILLFVGQAFIQLMMLMFLTDSVDYGHLKLGKRNDSINFSLQPFINKLSGAIGSGVVSAVVLLSGIKDAESAADVTEGGLMMMKTAMMVFPLICIVVSFFIYRWKYIIDEKKHAEILHELKERGELEADA
jgi:melibiose permease/lactose/raffinose/galactose permease